MLRKSEVISIKVINNTFMYVMFISDILYMKNALARNISFIFDERVLIIIIFGIQSIVRDRETFIFTTSNKN